MFRFCWDFHSADTLAHPLDLLTDLFVIGQIQAFVRFLMVVANFGLCSEIIARPHANTYSTWHRNLVIAYSLDLEAFAIWHHMFCVWLRGLWSQQCVQGSKPNLWLKYYHLSLCLVPSKNTWPVEFLTAEIFHTASETLLLHLYLSVKVTYNLLCAFSFAFCLDSLVYGIMHRYEL